MHLRGRLVKMKAHNSLILIEKRILLHLLNYNKSKDRFCVPTGLTHQGIAQAVGADRGYVSIPIKKLMSTGDVQECFGHVKRGKKQQKYFLLTDKGEKYTKKLKKELLDLQITLKRSDGMLKMMPLNTVLPYLSNENICPDITEQDLYNIISQDATLDIEYLKRIKEMRFVDFSAEAPKVVYFFGRKRELTTLEKWMEDKEGHNIIFIHGMAGIGKTTLAVKLIEKYRKSKHLFWHNFHELDTLRGVLFKLAEFLSKLGHDNLEIYLRTRTKLDHYEVSRILGKNIGFIDAVLIFDDFQKSNDQVRAFLNYILGMFTSSSKTKLLILSREIVPFYDENNKIISETVADLELGGLDFESSKKLLKEKGIDKQRFKEIYQFTAGNPLFLEILESKDRLERYMHVELFSTLCEAEREILGTISIYRFPVLGDCLAANDVDFEKLYALTQKSIVKKDDYDRYFIHDILRQFFYRVILPSKRKEHHLNAAQWYEDRGEPIDLIEAIYHYCQVKEYKKASQLTVDSSVSILESGYASELLATIESFTMKNVEHRVWAELQLVKGNACNMCGEWEQALLNFAQSEDIASILGDKKLGARAICESGHILEEQNELEKAMDTFKKCLDIYKEIDYLPGIGEAYRGLGRIYWRKENREKAIINYTKCLKVSENLVNSELMASTYVDLGNVYDELNEPERAIECYNKSLDLLKKCKNTYETARAYLNLAVTYEHLEEFDKAINYNTKQLALAQNLGDMKLLGYGYAEMGYCYAKMQEFEEAKGYAKKAVNIALKLDNDNIMNMINKTYGLISKHEGRLDEGIGYFKKSLDYLKKLKALYQLPDSHFQLGLLYEEKGDSENAKKHLGIAQKLYSKLGLEKAESLSEKLSKY
ncbi:MAG: tetratricopeptide repeat protein [Candidatus Hodarchaeota archaeon]